MALSTSCVWAELAQTDSLPIALRCYNSFFHSLLTAEVNQALATGTELVNKSHEAHGAFLTEKAQEIGHVECVDHTVPP